MVRRAGEEEGQRRPVARERAAREEADQAGLHEDGVLEQQLEDVEEEAGVFLPNLHLRVRAGVVRHEEIQQDQDEVLQPECDPVDVPPPDEFRHHARQHPCDQHPQQHPTHHDTQARGSFMRRRHVAYQRQHELRRDRRHRCNEGDRSERGEGFRNTQADPAGGSEPHEPEDEGPPFKEVAKRTEEEQAGGVAGLREGRNVGGLFVSHIKGCGKFVEDRVCVVEVRNGKAARESWRRD